MQKYAFFLIQPKKLCETAPQEWLSLSEPCRFRGRGLTEIKDKKMMISRDEWANDGSDNNAAGVHGGYDGIGAGLMPRARWLLGCRGFLFSAVLSAVSSHTGQGMGLMG